MAAQKGRHFLIKIEDSAGAGTYTALGGLRARSFTIGNPATDLSDSESPGAWMERGVGYGLKSMEIQGQGVFKQSLQVKIVNAILNSETLNYQMICPGLGTFEGPFVVDGMQMGAPHDGEVSFSCSFMSAGEISFTPSSS